MLIKNALLYTGGVNPQTIDSGYVVIKGGEIIEFGAMADLAAALQPAKVIDAHGGLLMPGLVNGHNHAAMTLFRGLADDLPLMTWLNEHVFPAEGRFVDADMVYCCSQLAAAEMLLSGTTTVADGYFHEDAAVKAFTEAGIRSVAAHGVIDFPAPGVADPAKNVDAAIDFVERWQTDSLITPGFFCHSPYTCGPDTLQKTKAAARKLQAPFFIHLAETEGEVAGCVEQYGQTPLKHLNDLGILDEQTTLVHGVWLNDEEIEILAASGARVVTCPESNMKLASGTAPVVKLLAAGIPVGLGTDGCASNNNLDMFAEMDICAKLHKLVNMQPTDLPAAQVVQMATNMGATALGLNNTCGEIAAGKRADLIIINTDQPHLTPCYNIASLLCYAAAGADVDTVLVDGKVVVENRRFLSFDLSECMAKVREYAGKVRAAKSVGWS